MTKPKLFISYCWSSTEHEEWVLRLSTELRENGVDVILDKWDLKEGNDAHAFMEKMVTDKEIKKVILIIDEKYNEKADKRSGGVGTETQIISAKIYERVEQSKFVAVIANRDQKGTVELPAFYKSRIYIDLSDENLYGKNFEQLLRWVYDEPLYVKPELGNKPAFLEEETSISIGTGVAFRRLVEAVKNSKPHAHGALLEYFDLLAIGIKRFELEPSKGATDFDQRVVDNIASTIPIRNELIEVYSTLAQYDNNTGTISAIHKFFESLTPYLDRPDGVNNHHDWDRDNLRFIIQENFLLCIAIFLKYERFDVVKQLLGQQYFVEKDPVYGQSKMHPFCVFRNYLKTLNHRNTRLNCKHVSLHADLMKERCSDSGISFEQVMQADFILYLADAMQGIREKRETGWWPVTLVFKSVGNGIFEIFLRAESKEYFDKLIGIPGIETKADLSPFVEGIENETISVPQWEYERINPLKLMNFEKLCSRA